MVQRTEFEENRKPSEITRGQVLRIKLQREITDFTGFVKEVKNNVVLLEHSTEWRAGQLKTFDL